MNYLGIDWGEKRIGLALGDSEVKIASPFKIVSDIDEVFAVIKEERIDIGVVGKPVSIINHESSITNKGYIKFIEVLKNKSGIKIELVDERLSSKAADALSGDKKTKAGRDALAAMIILQNYLDKKFYGRNLSNQSDNLEARAVPRK